MNILSLLIWGLVATATLTTILAAGHGLGLTRMSLPFMLGTMATRSRNAAMVCGSVLHFVGGWAFAVVYIGAFESLGRASWWIGGLGGLLHGALVLMVVMPLLPALHPRMATERHGPSPTRNLQPPGFMGLNYGRRTPLVTMVAHLVYGAILGALYEISPASLI